MADKKITDFTEATTVDDSDWLEIENIGGNSRKVKASNLEKVGGIKQIGTWTYSSDVAQVDFTGLTGYSYLLVVGHNLTTSVSGFRALRFSVDNGSSYYSASGDYEDIATTGGASNNTVAGTHATAATASRSIYAVIPNNIAGETKISMSQQAGFSRFSASTSEINAIRVLSTAGNFTGGSIRIFGRR